MIWHPQRLTRLSTAVVLGLLIGLAALWISDRENSSQLKRGDFPGFYAPAVIVDRGLGESLYDLELQRSIENEFWPSFDGEFYIYAYPPFLAVLLRPLAWLPPIEAKLTATMLLAAALACAVLAARPLAPLIREHPFFAFVLCISFPPMLSGVLAAQNTAVSLLLYLLAVRLLLKNTKAGDWYAGIALGLWLFKPQYPLLLLILLLAAGRWRACTGAGIPALIYYWAGASVSGWDWPITWPRVAAGFSEMNTLVNQAEIVSVHGVLASTGAVWFDSGGVWLRAGALLSSLAAVVFAVYFVKALRSPEESRHEGALLLYGPAIAVISPQTLFYDIGIAAVSVIAAAGSLSDRSVHRILAGYGIVLLVALLRSSCELPLYSVVSIGIVLMLAWVEAARAAARNQSDA